MLQKQIADKEAQFYNLDAVKIAGDVGLGMRRINSPMTAAFYHLSGAVKPAEHALKLLKENIARQYKHKGPNVSPPSRLGGGWYPICRTTRNFFGKKTLVS